MTNKRKFPIILTAFVSTGMVVAFTTVLSLAGNSLRIRANEDNEFLHEEVLDVNTVDIDIQSQYNVDDFCYDFSISTTIYDYDGNDYPFSTYSEYDSTIYRSTTSVWGEEDTVEFATADSLVHIPSANYHVFNIAFLLDDKATIDYVNSMLVYYRISDGLSYDEKNEVLFTEYDHTPQGTVIAANFDTNSYYGDEFKVTEIRLVFSCPKY